MKLDIGDKNSILDIEYNFEAYQDIKKVEGSKYNPEDDTWEINNKYLKCFLNHIQTINVYAKDYISIANEKIRKHEVVDFSEPVKVVKTIRVKILKENPKTYAIGFDYDKKVLELVKSIEGRVYNPKDKTWRISKDNIDWLYIKLEELGYVDTSELEPYIYHNSEVKLSPADFPDATIVPKDYQLSTASQLLKYKKIINGLEAGLGKTAITIMACEYASKKTVIVCPASVKYHWEKEIYQINPNANVVVLNGKSKWDNADYVILNYDILDRFFDDIINSDIEIVVFDEAHKIRGVNNSGNPTSKRAKYSIQIADKMEYVFPITATPYINQTKDIFNLLKVIKHPIANNWYRFANTYCNPQRTRFGTSYNGSSNQKQLNERLYPHGLIRLKTEDYVDLPDRVRSFIPVEINMRSYNKAVEEYMLKRDSLETNGEHLVYLGAMRRELAIAKAKEAVRLANDILEQNKSVVLFTNYNSVVEYLHGHFKDNAVVVTGDVDAKSRQIAVDEFQVGEKKVFIGNIDAAGEGLTLTKSHNMIIVDLHWSPVVMVNQMEKRIHRLTQSQPCSILYLYVPEAKIEQKQLELLESKLNDSSMIIDGKKEEFFTDILIKSFDE